MPSVEIDPASAANLGLIAKILPLVAGVLGGAAASIGLGFALNTFSMDWQ